MNILMKFSSFLFSSRMALILLVIFALSMATATFIENDFGTTVAWDFIYDSWWFEIIMVWLSLNFLMHLTKYKLVNNKNKYPIGLFHFAFIIILIGAGITRYISEDGIIHIRENETKKEFFTNQKYIQFIKSNHKTNSFYQKKLKLSKFNFSPIIEDFEIKDNKFKIIIDEYIESATKEFLKGNNTYLDVSVAKGKLGREDYLIKLGESIKIENITVTLDSLDKNSSINIFKTNNKWFIKSKVHLQIMEMATQNMGVLHSGEIQELKNKTLYQFDGGAFVIKEVLENKKLTYIKNINERNKNLPNVIHYNIFNESNDLIYQNYIQISSFEPEWQSFNYDGNLFKFTYGPQKIQLPFSLKLNKFELKRYPGSKSPSSYASYVKVIDNSKQFDYRIYMNNVLDYAGYRFYQSSYDNDELGTILTINKDQFGTYTTYFGYTLLTLGMFLSFFVKGGRLNYLNSILKKNQAAKTLIVLILLSVFNLDEIIAKQKTLREAVLVPIEISEAYGSLVVQDLDGRMKPLNTLSNEIVRKLTGKTNITLPSINKNINFTSEQFLLAVQLDPVGFSYIPILKTDKKKLFPIFKILNKKPTEYIAFKDLLGVDGDYLLSSKVEQANKLKPSERSDFDNELLKLDERFNIFYAVITGDFLRLFPNKNDTNNTWFTSQQFDKGFDEEDALFVKNITTMFLTSLEKGLVSKDFKEAKETLEYIRLFQEKAGSKVYPDKTQIQLEILYNKFNLSQILFVIFWLLGLLLLSISIINIFIEDNKLSKIWDISSFVSWLGWIAYSIQLIMRWYIANHPPWSDGYEMLVFVGWGVLLIGLILRNKSKFTLPMGLLFSGTLLFVSFLDWLNPEITNLMPVLHSYWLKIHVAVIISGYAPLALSATLALLYLILLILKPKSPTVKWYNSMQEITIVSEMSILIGLFLLTIGTFLGGVWANESWGRYWAWDPKETWALISIIIYSVILHLRLVPVLKTMLIFNLATLWGFSTIIMTSFGVNYYLTGLHSYAKGDPVPIPIWVYWVVFICLLISILAIIRNKQIFNENKDNITIGK